MNAAVESAAAVSTADDRLMTIAELAAYLQIPEQTVYRWRKRGTGPKGFRVGRPVQFRRDDVDAWFETLGDRVDPTLRRHRRGVCVNSESVVDRGLGEEAGAPWQAGYTAADGRQHTAMFSKKDDAQRWVNDLESRKARGEWTNPAWGRQRFGDIARLRRETDVFRETPGDWVDSVLRNHILPHFGMLPIGTIRPSQVQA